MPNFSEGRHQSILDKICSAIESIAGVHLLDIDSGFDANRTVMTMAGSAASVAEAAFAAIRTAAEQIDMRTHQGVHPRVGATDVCPIIPLGSTTMQECIALARALGERVGSELNIPVYLYAHAALLENRRHLAYIRRGEYEGFQKKLEQQEWKPDFGPAQFNPASGATAIGARPLLIAFNINLDTRDLEIARDIAAAVRESGRKIQDQTGKAGIKAGRLKHCKAIGWYLKQYDKAQVSMNLTDYRVTPLHTAFETVKEEAEKRGVHITGSELVGMCPENALLASGRYYLGSESDTDALIRAAVQDMGLNELKPFDPETKIIEKQIEKLFKG